MKSFFPGMGITVTPPVTPTPPSLRGYEVNSCYEHGKVLSGAVPVPHPKSLYTYTCKLPNRETIKLAILISKSHGFDETLADGKNPMMRIDDLKRLQFVVNHLEKILGIDLQSGTLDSDTVDGCVGCISDYLNFHYPESLSGTYICRYGVDELITPDKFLQMVNVYNAYNNAPTVNYSEAPSLPLSKLMRTITVDGKYSAGVDPTGHKKRVVLVS